MKANETLRIYVVVINYNGANDTIECLESLKRVRYSHLHIVLVDNASKKENIRLLKKYLKSNFDLNVHLIESETNLGFAGGNNRGISYALQQGADYVCLLNNDTIVEPDFLENMINAAELNKKIAIVSPMIKDYYQPDKISYGGGEINVLKGGVYIYGINTYNLEMMNKGRYISFASGCCMLIKKKAIEEVGSMQEGYFLYYEDTDYSVKIIQAGFKIWYNPESVIYHKESASTKKNSDDYQYYNVRNRFIFIKENFTWRNKITAYPISLLFVLKKIILMEFTIGNVCDGIIDFIYGKKGKRE